TERLTQWTRVPYETKETRALGYRPASWDYEPGVVRHISGETWGQLFFQSPLRGQFEIVAQRSTRPGHEVSISYGMYSAEPNSQLDGLRVFGGLKSSKTSSGYLKIPQWDEVADLRIADFRIVNFRIIIDGPKIVTLVNGVQIHQQRLSPQPDPWLTLQASTPGNRGIVRNLQIIGKPEIPDEIRLLETAELAGWRADLFGESFSPDNDDEKAAWRRVGEEIRGSTPADKPASSREGLLMYGRPMLEDGQMEWEAYYVPDKFEVHPTIGRTAYMIRPGGVQLHQLTDGEWESGGLLPDNESALEPMGEIVLKEKGWNRYRLALARDKLTLWLNGTVVAEQTIAEPAAARFFGLFRYIDKTGCRVRNVVYRGDWPKNLPGVEQQQLANPAGI
ncbi:MAG: DUF1583 domain-containing protein, partial [Halocynthiibacter sp.]